MIYLVWFPTLSCDIKNSSILSILTNNTMNIFFRVDEAEFAEYFQFPNVLSTMLKFASDMFGIQIKVLKTYMSKFYFSFCL